MKIVEFKQRPDKPESKDVLIATCDDEYEIVSNGFYRGKYRGIRGETEMFIDGEWVTISYVNYIVLRLEELKQEGYEFTPKAEALLEWYKSKFKEEQEEKERQEQERQRLLKENQEKQNEVEKAIPNLTKKNKLCHAFGCLINASECFSCRYYSVPSRMCIK